MGGERSGPIKPRNLLIYGLLFAGLAMLVIGRAVPELGGSFSAGFALLLIACSRFAEAALPGGSRLAPEQVAMISQLRIPYGERFETLMNLAFGTAILIPALYLMFG